MLRSSLIAVGATLICSVAAAQNKVDATRLTPIHGNVRDAGIYNMRTGKWFPSAQSQNLSAAQQIIYRNDCFSSANPPFGAGTWYYTGFTMCEDAYDEGRVPASGPSGAGPDNATNTYSIGYCTGATLGSVDIDWNLWDTNGNTPASSCTGPVSGPPPAAIVGFSSAAAGFPLPGATSGGGGCWTVTFTTGTASACMQSGASSADLFAWAMTYNNTTAQTGGFQGSILAGDPGAAAGGAGTYNIPPGTDTVFGTPCGTGLDNQDYFYLNVDGTVNGGTPPPACAAQGAGSTGCYWFGGYVAGNPNSTPPVNAVPFAGMYFTIEANGGCGCTGNVTVYCTSKTASNGCVPVIGSTGTPDANAGSGFIVTTSKVVNNKNGVHFYSTAGLLGAPFQGGFLCVKAPIKRLPVQNSGSAGPACGTATNSGSLVTDFNVRIASGIDPNLVAGAFVGIQSWFRDPASPSTTGLSNALNFTICP